MEEGKKIPDWLARLGLHVDMIPIIVSLTRKLVQDSWPSNCAYSLVGRLQVQREFPVGNEGDCPTSTCQKTLVLPTAF
jgi:hypothetical protein